MDLPNGLDWADGQDGRAGTATPAANRKVKSGADGETIPIQEKPESPEFERAEQGTITHQFTLDWEEAINRIQFLGRGTILEDSFGNVTKVMSSKIKRERGHHASLIVVAESVSFDSPPDEFRITPVELGVDILKNPRYRYALDPTLNDYTNKVTVGDTQVSLASVKESIIRAVQTYRDSPFFPGSNSVNGLVQNMITGNLKDKTIDVDVKNPNFIPGFGIAFPEVPMDAGAKWDGTTANIPAVNYRFLTVSVPTTASGIQLAAAAAQEIIQKLWRMEDTPYLIGYDLEWSSYHFRPQKLNPGGYIEDPILATPGLPDYFYSTDYPPTGTNTIFDDIARLNPQSYADDGTITGEVDISWLRKADEIDWQRTWFKITRRWSGSPIGHWDKDFYSQNRRPVTASDYNQLATT